MGVRAKTSTNLRSISLIVGYVLLLAAASFGTVARADPGTDLQEARAALTGTSLRAWVKERVVVSMGGGSRCTAGETYAFRSNGTVDIAICTDHVLVKRNVPWALVSAPPIDVNLRFDGRVYQLSFGGTPQAPKMRWRKLGQVKPDPTMDIYLGLSKD